MDILNSQALQRLKHINQYGTWYLIRPELNTTRFEHSMGVMILLGKLGADIKEQAAGLIHDVAHTAFSHVVDYVYGRERGQDFHEKYAGEFIKKTDLPHILKKHGFDWQELLDEKKFKMLEQPIPELCADRMDYFLRDGLLMKQIDQQFINDFIKNLEFYRNRFALKSQDIARRGAEIYLRMGDLFWGNPMQSTLFHILSRAIKIGLDEGLVNKNDLFTVDRELLAKLQNGNNEKINEQLSFIRPGISAEQVGHDWDFHIFTKTRYIDPPIKFRRGIKRLSEVDRQYKLLLHDFINARKDGYKIKISCLAS